MIAAPTFGIYAALTTLYGGAPIIVPLRDYTVDLPALLAAVNAQTRLVFVCNPNNPTGTFASHAALEEFLDQLPLHVTLVLDEAYREFADALQMPRAEEWVAAARSLNFIFILLRDLPLPAEEIVRKTEEMGVVLNHTAWAGLPGNVRITFARQHENARVIETLRWIVNGE